MAIRILYSALKSGSIDLISGYTGTIARRSSRSKAIRLAELNRRSRPSAWASGTARLQRQLRARDARDRASALASVRSRSRETPGLKLGLSQEFIGRGDVGRLEAAYGCYATPRGSTRLAYEAIAAGR